MPRKKAAKAVVKRKPAPKAPEVARKGRLVIIDADPAEIKRALRLLRKEERAAPPDRVALALKLLSVVERLVRTGRMKRPYTRRKRRAT